MKAQESRQNAIEIAQNYNNPIVETEHILAAKFVLLIETFIKLLVISPNYDKFMEYRSINFAQKS
ncbi:MAG: hypothetical protein AB1775_01610 [Bacteroidota bacterium]